MRDADLNADVGLPRVVAGSARELMCGIPFVSVLLATTTRINKGGKCRLFDDFHSA
jgi:hypothetical protein